MTTAVQLSGPSLRANLHTHTTNSDGEFPLHQVVGAYALLGYGALAITDHNLWRNHSSASSEKLLVLSANEPSLGKREHMLAIGANGPAPTDQGDGNRPPTRMQEVIDWTLEQGGFPVLNHPTWSGMSVERCIELQRFEALEIYNGSCVGYGSEHGITHWDELLRRGRRVFGVATDDSHSTWDRGLGWIEVFSKSTEKAFIAALKAGRFYSTTGPRFKRIDFDGKRIAVECEPVLGIAVMSEAGPLHSEHYKGKPVTRMEWKLPKQKVAFLRLELHRADGKKAWSNPFWVE